MDTTITYTNDIIGFVQRLRKRLSIAEQLSFETTSPYTKLKALCPTRWTVKVGSMYSLLKNYEVIKDVLDTVIDENDKSGTTTNGYLQQMNQFQYYFGLKLGNLIFSATEQVSCTIQRVDNCLQDVLYSVETVLKYFERIRNGEQFNQFYKQVIKEAKQLVNEPKLPRQRRAPKRYDEGSNPHTFNSSEDYFRNEYFEPIDIIINTLQKRFKQSTFSLLCKVEQFLIQVSNSTYDTKQNKDDLDNIHDFLENDIVIDHLKIECLMINDYFKLIINQKQWGTKKITKISTICDLMNEVVGKNMFHEFDKLIRLYLTTASAERAFSTLNRLKNSIRSTMHQEHLNYCLIARIYKEKIDGIDHIDICTIFIQSNERRQAYFGSFAELLQ
ncbi:unnamed protein product [Didymodactylos carnosus]|uniref:HAT C-terminal dimerisation domain-containing protein n=1 Tax=Didymodactylos carnosus TaxID=1234261 RepID=A0A814SE08_9BILA|nr:unnamed protein product [Didymodactylos carnosus]CAF3908781.1 unnamed protein product [Didymodactylos carnosus]